MVKDGIRNKSRCECVNRAIHVPKDPIGYSFKDSACRIICSGILKIRYVCILKKKKFLSLEINLQFNFY